MKAIAVGQKWTNEAHDTSGQFFTLSHPMLFVEPDHNAVPTPGSVDKRTFFETTDVYVCCVRDVIPRVLIHACKKLQGDDGLAYPFGTRTVEGISNADMALMLQGYGVN